MPILCVCVSVCILSEVPAGFRYGACVCVYVKVKQKGIGDHTEVCGSRSGSLIKRKSISIVAVSVFSSMRTLQFLRSSLSHLLPLITPLLFLPPLFCLCPLSLFSALIKKVQSVFLSPARSRSAKRPRATHSLFLGEHLSFLNLF